MNEIKYNKGNIPINKDLLNKYANVSELISDNVNNYDGRVNVKKKQMLQLKTLIIA